MADTETTVQHYISKHTGDQIEYILDEAKKLLIPLNDNNDEPQKSKISEMEDKLAKIYTFFYENDSVDTSLHFLSIKNKELEWALIPDVEGVEL